MTYEEQYLNLLDNIINHGDYVGDRTNTGCYSLLGSSIKVDLSHEFPILTTKKIDPKLPIGELLWMLSGDTSLPSLREYQNKPKDSHTIWSDDFSKYLSRFDKNGWSYKHLSRHEILGAIYGEQLRNYHYRGDPDGDRGTHDQLITLIDNIKSVKENPNHPMARRLICSWWNPYDHTLGDKVTCALPACHTDFQCLVRDGKLNLRFSMRSSDVFLGLPFNFCFYATLCHILAKITGLDVGELIYFGTDVHIYSNHTDQVKEQLSREPREAPELVLPEFTTLEELLTLTGADFKLESYSPHPFIKAPQAS